MVAAGEVKVDVMVDVKVDVEVEVEAEAVEKYSTSDAVGIHATTETEQCAALQAKPSQPS